MAGTIPRGITKKQVETLYNPGSQNGVKTSSNLLDAAQTVEVLQFGAVVAKLTVQAADSLVCDVEVSANGTDFVAGMTAVDSVAPVSYKIHNITAIKIIRTSGEGKLKIAGTI